ncbi:hypothetical protein ACFQY0_18625 [Haloferula chungangensis]|uniref:DUF7668 domain-containing protein n=1 Tax=Haloferula chungangensis TaxID=1048331 RepID=A0ABW2LEK0_9BACT
MENEQIPIPVEWRQTIREIVKSFVRRDYRLTDRIAGVGPVNGDTAQQIQGYIEDYGETLIELPDESWATSVASLQAPGRWEFLVDLWTEESGRSDMVLHGDLEGEGSDQIVRIHLVYVP